jgi:pyruvate dehydrogenase E2 component (dihydrolipoamide acetyltransferase)
MTEGSVVTWLKKKGDWVDKGEILFTTETDKAVMEVESMGSGYLSAIRVEPGQKVPVGTVIAFLGDQPGEPGPVETAAGPVSPGAPAVEAVPSAPVVISPQTTPAALGPAVETAPPERFTISPRARRLARELEIDIEAVTPARGVRVVEEDVRRFHALAAAKRGAQEAVQTREFEGRASSIRKITALRMTESFQNAPHFYLGAEANVRELVKLRESLIEPFKQQIGVKPTYTDLLIRALGIALREQSQVNAFWQNGEIVKRDTVEIGFAVQTAEGLVVPVVRNVDQMSLVDLTKQRQALTDKAKAGKLGLQDLEGGSATLSNLGNLGIDWFEAILNPPQSTILAAGQISKRPMVISDSIEICPSLTLTLSVDHRVLDGVAAANFLVRIKYLIENPSLVLS